MVRRDVLVPEHDSLRTCSPYPTNNLGRPIEGQGVTKRPMAGIPCQFFQTAGLSESILSSFILPCSLGSKKKERFVMKVLTKVVGCRGNLGSKAPLTQKGTPLLRRHLLQCVCTSSTISFFGPLN